jgi:hypothetical protein
MSEDVRGLVCFRNLFNALYGIMLPTRHYQQTQKNDANHDHIDKSVTSHNIYYVKFHIVTISSCYNVESVNLVTPHPSEP